jgi:hypothetical protein
MAFKSAFVIMAPDGDPKRHRATIKTSKLELVAVVVGLMNFDQAVDVCKNLVQNEGVQAIILCPGFHHEAVARVRNAVGQGVAVNVARGDVPSGMITGKILAKEGWFPEGQ